MAVATINHWVILVAVGASFVFGAVWYSALSKPWLDSLRTTPEALRQTARPMPVLFAITIAALLVMASVLAGLIAHLSPGQMTLRNGVISALLVWLGFVATALATNYAYQGRSWSLLVIDGGYWLGVLLLQGAIIGAYGGR